MSTISPPASVLPAGSISPRTGIKTTIVHGLLSPMRDGTLLAMDLIRPEAPGAYPVVLVRTPYDKTMGRTLFLPFFDALPLASLPAKANFASAWWDEMMRHPNLDDLWRSCSYQDAWPQITVPALNITGWWDMNFPGAPMNFVGMRAQGGTEAIRQAQQIIIGPWPHRVNLTRSLNGVDFGEQSIVNLDDYMVRFYDRWLKGIENGIERDPRVHVFVIGANEWWTANDWPLPEAKPTPFFLHSRGRANSLKGDGVLSRDEPGAESRDAYVCSGISKTDPLTTGFQVSGTTCSATPASR